MNCSWYDPFEGFRDGIYKIDSEQYKEFNRGRGIKSNGCAYEGDIYMLKREKKYMFILQTPRSLCLLVGGRRNRLGENNIQYYYDNMIIYSKRICELIKPYQIILKQLSEEVKSIGGTGLIHGCIVDISYYSHICRITGTPQSIISLSGMDFSDFKLTINEKGAFNPVGEKYDIGFVVPFELVNGPCPRSYADAFLRSRMKIRQTTVRADDLMKSIVEAETAKGPIDIHEKMLDALSDSMKNVIKQYITPDNLEKVVCWYFKKKGADSAFVLPRNPSEKEGYEDADVQAEFEDLGIVYYVQVKKHEGVTDDWSVYQIEEYTKKKESKKNSELDRQDDDSYTYIPWVITLAKSYTDDALGNAKKARIRLINGKEFVDMIMDVGIDGIEEVNEKEN